MFLVKLNQIIQSRVRNPTCVPQRWRSGSRLNDRLRRSLMCTEAVPAHCVYVLLTVCCLNALLCKRRTWRSVLLMFALADLLAESSNVADSSASITGLTRHKKSASIAASVLAFAVVPCGPVVA